MDSQEDTTTPAGSASRSDYLDLETGLHHTYRFALILADMIEDTLQYGSAEKFGEDSFRFTLGRDTVENITFMSIQAQHAASELKDQFYRIASGRPS